MLSRRGSQHDDGLVHRLGVGRVGHGLGLDRGVHRHPLQVAGLRGSGCVGHARALGQQQLQAVAEPAAPVAQPGAFVRDLVLEVGLAGEVRLTEPASPRGPAPDSLSGPPRPPLRGDVAVAFIGPRQGPAGIVPGNPDRDMAERAVYSSSPTSPLSCVLMTVRKSVRCIVVK